MTEQLDARPIAVLANISPVIAMVVSVNSLSLLAPLAFWLFYRDKSPLVRRCAAETFNFSLVTWLIAMVGYVLIFTVILLPVGMALVLASAALTLIFPIIGALRANDSQVYVYPLRFLPVLD